MQGAPFDSRQVPQKTSSITAGVAQLKIIPILQVPLKYLSESHCMIKAWAGIVRLRCRAVHLCRAKPTCSPPHINASLKPHHFTIPS
jgi:hypothetical protein